ncbi:MAG: hypothetical protein K8T10_16160 [Candidatus Eremiobacteraeota bacterium]|nr:hypothetical protein [Candidatus Eremiobacteraeota bacterium]
MKHSILNSAEQVVKNRRLKTDLSSLLDEYEGDLQDIMLIFVRNDWEVDVFWTNLPQKKVRKVLSAIDRGVANPMSG